MSRYDDPDWKYIKDKDIWLWTNPALDNSKQKFTNEEYKSPKSEDQSLTQMLGLWWRNR